MLEQLRQAGAQPMTLDQLRAGGIDFPAVVIGELELNGYVIERVHDHGKLLGVRLLETEAPDPPTTRPPTMAPPAVAIATQATSAAAGVRAGDDPGRRDAVAGSGCCSLAMMGSCSLLL
jgi:hypothetical protein